jgi:dethiobiotin synthetase/adenosylmethionine--8-amino-7-oxononanoate aminotransferase
MVLEGGSYVLRHTSPYADHISTHNLFQYREPMSPHLAAQLAPDLVSARSIHSYESFT